MKFIKFIIIAVTLLCVTSCAQTGPLSPTDYTQLLTNIKDFFTTSLFLLGSNCSNFQIGQAITRLYYGHYHIARLIYNNKNKVDIDNHTRAWDAMQVRIQTYGKELKTFRIKYDYSPQNFSNSEIEQDLQFIKDNRSEFDYMITELKSTIVSFNNDPNFLNNANKEIQNIENEYNSIIAKIGKINSKRP